MALSVCVSFVSLASRTWHDLLSASSLVILLLPFADPRWGIRGILRGAESSQQWDIVCGQSVSRETTHDVIDGTGA